MTCREAERLLANFPRLMREAREAREAVLHSGGRGDAFVIATGEPGRSDSTARKALALAEIGKRLQLYAAVNDFLDTLDNDDKRVVVIRWRMPWATTRVRDWTPYRQARWEAIILRLAAYLTRYAGTAAGLPSASAAGPGSRCQGQR